MRYGTLPNGLRYVILHNDLPAGHGALRLRMNVGWISEQPSQRGLAHLLEHMAFNGSTHIPEGQVVPMLERHGMALGAGVNAYTSLDETVFSLDLPQSSSDAIEASLLVLREIASELTLAPEAIDRERGVVLAEGRSASAAGHEATEAQLRFLYPEGAFVDRLPGIRPDVVGSASAQQVRDFYETWYRPEKAFLLFVGDAPADEVERQIIRKFSGWRARAPAPLAPEMGRIAPRGLEVGFVRHGTSGTAVTLASVRPANDRRDTAEARFDELLRNVANAIVNERLARLAFTHEPPFSSASVTF